MNIPTSPGCWILLTLYSGNAFCLLYTLSLILYSTFVIFLDFFIAFTIDHLLY